MILVEISLVTFDFDCLIGDSREDTFAADVLQQTLGMTLRDRKLPRSDMYVPK